MWLHQAKSELISSMNLPVMNLAVMISRKYLPTALDTARMLDLLMLVFSVLMVISQVRKVAVAIFAECFA